MSWTEASKIYEGVGMECVRILPWGRSTFSYFPYAVIAARKKTAVNHVKMSARAVPKSRSCRIRGRIRGDRAVLARGVPAQEQTTESPIFLPQESFARTSRFARISIYSVPNARGRALLLVQSLALPPLSNMSMFHVWRSRPTCCERLTTSAADN